MWNCQFVWCGTHNKYFYLLYSQISLSFLNLQQNLAKINTLEIPFMEKHYLFWPIIVRETVNLKAFEVTFQFSGSLLILNRHEQFLKTICFQHFQNFYYWWAVSIKLQKIHKFWIAKENNQINSIDGIWNGDCGNKFRLRTWQKIKFSNLHWSDGSGFWFCYGSTSFPL